jgi:hypothetical protein
MWMKNRRKTTLSHASTNLLLLVNDLKKLLTLTATIIADAIVFCC